jgi:two-component system cell cycle sensor histidine kinase/response regulator CckA
MTQQNLIDVLLVEDSLTDAFLVQEALGDSSRFRLVHVQRLSEALQPLSQSKIAMVLLDLGLPDSQGLETLRKLKESAHGVPVIVLTGNNDEEMAVNSARQGAQEYLVKSQLQEGNLRRTIRHVIERDRTEKALRESEQQLRAIIDNSPQCIKVLNSAGDVLQMNSAGIGILDAENAMDVLGKNIFSLITPEDREKYHAFHDAICRGNSGTLEFDVISLIGVRRSLLSTSAPLLHPDGTTLHLAITQDVTKRKEAEAELYLRERAIQAVSQGILITDAIQPDEPIIYASLGFEKMTGYSAAEIAGKNCRFLQGPETDPATIETLREAIKVRRKCAVEILNYRQDGTPFWNAISIAPIIDDGLAVKHLVGVMTDVTERRELESQLRQSQKMEAVGQLAGGVAHDFNNLLTIILGSCDELQSCESLSAYGIETLGNIHQASLRAAALTRQLLAFSRKQLLNPVVLNLNEIITNIHKMALRLIGEDIELSWKPFPSLWPVKLDPGQIEQVILNLVVNARDAMPAGGRLSLETINVEWSDEDCRLVPDRKPGCYVMLLIGDNGTGIPSEVKSRIFEPFFTTKGAGKGTGLGLSVVHGIVKQSDGYIEVDSLVDKGTSFRLYFPAVKEHAVIAANGQLLVPPKFGTETVLLVEDEEGVRTIARLALERQGYTVLEAGNGQEALAVAEKHSGVIEMVLTDVVMPMMGGRQLSKLLSERFPAIKVVYMTGYTDDAILRQGLSHDSHALLQKPFSMLELVQKVQAVLSEKPIELVH